MGEKTDDEGDVCLDTSDTELNERSEHLSSGNLKRGTADGALDEQRVVVRGDLRTGVTGRSVQSYTVTTGRSVHLDLARVRLETLRGVFGGDTTLDGETTSVDVLLGQTELSKGDTGSDLDLGGDNVDTGDLLCDSVLDLDTRVDLDKVVTALLVDQEFSGTRVSVVDSLGQFQRVVEDRLTDRLVEVGGRSDFDDLWLV